MPNQLIKGRVTPHPRHNYGIFKLNTHKLEDKGQLNFFS